MLPFADHRGTGAMSIAFCMRRIIVAGSCVLWAASTASALNTVDAFHRSDKTSLIIDASVGGGDDTCTRLPAPNCTGATRTPLDAEAMADEALARALCPEGQR